jgi:CheY-like chemotaxis protein
MKAGEYVLLSVADTGVGIPREIQDEVFEPFFTTKDRATSSGLGLATVHAIVQQSRGVIRLDSAADGGATFEIYLPRSREHFAEKATGPMAIPLAPGSQRILLVEDNEELRQSTQEALEVLGYSIMAASDGEEAVRMFEDGGRSIELLITDVVMSGMNGRQVMEHLREKKKHLPVIFVSGYTGDAILRHGVMEEDVNFLPKPFTVETLARKIQEVLGQPPADRST